MAQGFLQIAIFCAVLVAIMPVLGNYMARLFSREEPARVEAVVYRALGVNPGTQQDWKTYAKSVIAFSAVGWLLLYLILRTQTLHPLNPNDFHSGTWDLSFNTASSFVTNTNWQYYGGETTLSNFSQMTGLAVQNFVSAGVGIAVAVALIRAIAMRRSSATTKAEGTIGNFWVDLTRACLYVLLPISIVAGLLLASRGVVQSLDMSVASQEAIKELGTNGGGYFNVNSSHPFENPTGFTNFLEMVLMLCIPVSLTWTYGRMVGNRREGLAIFAAMGLVFLVGVAVIFAAEHHGTPALHAAGLDAPNLEGKEVRFGDAGTALWAAVTTATSSGAVNGAMESLTGTGSLVPFANMSMSETIFGGVGTGLYSMLLFVLLSVFIGGLMVGRTPEYLGKKVEAREIKLVALGTLVHADRRARCRGRRARDEVGHAVDLRVCQAAGRLRDAVRLPLPGQQQRLGVCRLYRRDVRRPPRWLGDDSLPLRADPHRARRRGLAGAEALGADRGRHAAHGQPDVCRAAHQRRRDRGCAHVLPGPAPRPDHPGPDRQVVLTCVNSAPQRSRSSS